MLFDSGKFKLSEPKAMNPEERQKKAKEQFEPWFESANLFCETAFTYRLKRHGLKIAAFELHQATERFYVTILLVFTDYKPKIHDIEN
jgi:HEPN domain-containing protein